MFHIADHLKPCSLRSPASILAAAILATAILATCLTACSRTAVAAPPEMRAILDPTTGRADLFEGEKTVLSYNYQTVSPSDALLEKVHSNNRKYARPRSNYIHPLYGPDGEVLTEDWSVDHPHHRGIYWAWPEVDYRGERGDLHALQRVFARPTGKIHLSSEAGYAEIEAENLWNWNDKTPIVREVATIRAYPTEAHGRKIDLVFSFTAIGDDVSLARRGTDLYGGLNVRLSPIRDLELTLHTDPDGATPRRAWADSVGIRKGGSQPVGVAIFENKSNPQYPGQWIEYPNLPWFQPTFPAAGNRYVLKQNEPLVLEYRLWIRRGGKLQEAAYDQQWRDYQAAE